MYTPRTDNRIDSRVDNPQVQTNAPKPQSFRVYYEAPPLRRSWVDTALPIFRMLLGAAFVAYSAYATVFLVAMYIAPVTGDRISVSMLPDRIWIGLVLALVLFVGQVATAERWPEVYLLFLVPDAFLTAQQLHPGLSTLITAHAGLDGLSVVLLAWTISGILGVAIARYGETLLFGKRRKLRTG